MNLKNILELADKAISDNNHVYAKSLIEKELELNPNIFELNFKLGLLHNILGDLKKAASFYEKTILLNSNFSPAYCNLGIVYEKLNNRQLAIKHHLTAIEKDPKNFKAYFNLANCYFKNDDLKIEAFKASGAGGQSVQKNSSAIRLTHKPSGIVVSVQNERSQSQNKNIALQILKSRLVDLENVKNKEKENELKGEFVSAEWGNQVRSYVLHPYTLVKDIRSGFEMPDAQRVLDGDLDQLLYEFLKFINKSQNTN